MKHLAILLICVSALFMVQCKNGKQTASVEGDTQQTEKMIRPVNVIATYEWPGNTSPFKVLQSTCVGDVLSVVVEYSGGCETHDWTMNTNRVWMKSLPPKINLFLEHDNHGDNCRALIQDTLLFDVTNLRYPQGKQANFILNNDPTRVIEYKY
ncbi:MAG: hypothetical protein RL220_1914 [Bacteroidota bacterium]